MKMPRHLVPIAAGIVALALGAAVAVALVRRDESKIEGERANRLQEAPSDSGHANDLFGDVDIASLTDCLGMDDLLDDLERSASSGAGTPDESARSQIRTISRQVENIRKLEFRTRYKVEFLPAKAVAERAAKLMLRDYPADVADSEGRVLASLGAVPPGTDLRKLSKELLESQVAGFYVPSADELVVPSTDPSQPLTANEKIVLAHELEHALVDQTIGLPIRGQPDPRKADMTLAALSVAEGDATLTMQRYALKAIPLSEQLSMLSDPTFAAAEDALADTPHFLARQLAFPYTAGLEFNCALFTRGGWRAVDRAYKDPPTTSAQVMFPRRYVADESAVEARDPAAPGSGWTKDMESTFGAAHLQWLFEAPGDDESRALDDPEGAASSWSGGEVHLFTRGSSSAVALALEERRGGEGLCAAVTEWYESAFDDEQAPVRGSEQLARDGASQDAIVWCSGGEVRVGIGPNLKVARALVE
jgi:hypothetical protein